MPSVPPASAASCKRRLAVRSGATPSTSTAVKERQRRPSSIAHRASAGLRASTRISRSGVKPNSAKPGP